jgi:hypothetical protein
LARYKLDLLGVEEVRRDKGGHGKGRKLNYFLRKKKETKIINWEQDCLYTIE